MTYLMGIDIGGTKTEVSILKMPMDISSHLSLKNLTQWASSGGRPEIIFRERVKTLRLKGFEQVMRRIAELAMTGLQAHNLSADDLMSIGIGMPGPVDPIRNQMIHGNSAIFVDKDISNTLSTRLGFHGKVVCGNDANCFVLAESCIGKASHLTAQNPKSCIIGIVLGTGVGGGCFVDGKMLLGKRGSAGEFGHMTLFQNGHPCYCGQLGCSEQYLSGPALEAAFTRRIYAQIESRPSANQIFELAEQFDPIAMAIVKRYKKHLAQFLSQLSQAFDPHAIVIGGGLSKQPEIYKGIEEMMKNYLYLPEDGPMVLQNDLGDSAGVVGAAFLPILNDMM
ncbi:MAG: ROK family protein [Zetaproteobacteria bacterium]|nr:ROK family protein [Zetaproteobacteria bacterium]